MSVKSFTIDRSIWLRALPPVPPGQPIDDIKATGSYLLREIDRKRCCLGIYLQACGVPDVVMEGIASPGYLFRERSEARPLMPEWLVDRDWDLGEGGNSFVATALMEINDDDTIDDAAKEAFIIRTFAGEGVEVTFV